MPKAHYDHLELAEQVMKSVDDNHEATVEDIIAGNQQVMAETLLDIAYNLRRIANYLENGGQR